ncbi:MAG: hypothetical protein HC824_16230 [Synechococcales cyanobacterium RM1_1_8]|nr:hypothetical protein [Synechococcales cyanobacterium RM1_1_8]
MPATSITPDPAISSPPRSPGEADSELSPAARTGNAGEAAWARREPELGSAARDAASGQISPGQISPGQAAPGQPPQNQPAWEQSASPAKQVGPFRLGNQTEHPIRIAFLAGGGPASPAAAGSTPARAPARSPVEPFHWDFAPGEGSRDGLLLALPQGDLSLAAGDVLVAFAQDGSQEYWGPYVVGQTALPYWDGDRQEWQLLIQP